MAAPIAEAAGLLPDDFWKAVLQALAEDARCARDSQDAGSTGVSLPRLCKLLGLPASTVMRQLTSMGDACGMGWVHVEQREGRFMVHLTDDGHRLAAKSPDAPDTSCAEQAASAFEPNMPRSLVEHPARVFSAATQNPQGRLRQDKLAAEVPVALVFNGIAHAVMMATPQDLEAFALGFSLSEGIIADVGELRGIDVSVADSQLSGLPTDIPALAVHLEISSRGFEQLKSRRRVLAGRTGCGICGVESLAALDLLGPPMAYRPWLKRVDSFVVLSAFAKLQKQQVLNAEAGALHAAGWATLEGDLTEVLEDVGRHNALDKLLGTLALQGRLTEPGFVIMSSRASHELVRKCARLGVSALATISAPTSMGVRLAELSGVRLWGLCRAPGAVLYSSGNGAHTAPRPFSDQACQ